jgi:hypothetical protein
MLVEELQPHPEVPPEATEQTPPWHWLPEAHCARPPCAAPSTATQCPCEPATSHAKHWLAQTDSQHVPSTQWPWAHSPSPAQTIPSANAATHIPKWQTFPAAQSPSELHLVAQTSPAQANGAHGVVIKSGHPPEPSQYAPKVATPNAQLAALHRVLPSAGVQTLAFTPSQAAEQAPDPAQSALAP